MTSLDFVCECPAPVAHVRPSGTKICITCGKAIAPPPEPIVERP